MAVRSFLEEYDFAGKAIVPFATSLSAGIEESLSDIQRLCPDAQIGEGLLLTNGQGDRSDEIRVWLEGQDLIAEEKQVLKMKITVGGKTLTATLEDNATTRALMDKMPMTLPMMDLYGREMCYRFEEELPAEEAGYDSFDVGDISYWTPWHSFVIVYAESGESIDNLQRIGTVDEGVEWLSHMGDTEVTFEMMSK